MPIEDITIREGVSISGYSGEYIFDIIKSTGTFYEAEILNSWISPLADDINIVYDIGANLGNHSIFFAHKTKAKIFSFEPVKDNYRLLELNILNNNLADRVIAINNAVGSAEGSVYLNCVSENNYGTAQIGIKKDDSFSAKMVRIDDLDLPAPDFIKIDVEGYELEVLAGMQQTLSQCSPYIWIEIDEKNIGACYDTMFKLGYTPCSYFLNKNNNVLFKKSLYDNNAVRNLFNSLLQTATASRYCYMQRADLKTRLGKEASKFLYEQQKATKLQHQCKELQSQYALESQKVLREQQKVTELQHQCKELQSQYALESQKVLSEQQKSRDLLQKYEEVRALLENEQKRTEWFKERLGKEASKFLYEQRKCIDLKSQIRQFELTMNDYKKSVFYKSMVSSRKISASITEYFFSKKTKKNSNTSSHSSGSQPITPKYPKDMHVAVICDEFTWNSFRFEFHAHELTPDNWREVFEKNHIDLFFCESAWSGTDSLKRPWRGRIYASTNFKKENRTVLLEILAYCKDKGIPTAFWNKEDPTHYDDRIHDFVSTAKLFDHVFTTAEECVEKYKNDYHLKSVHLLMFATQPRLFNPLNASERTDEIIFAGSWYRQHAARCEEMEAIFDSILASPYSLKIYNRQSHNPDPNHTFPEKYLPYVHERLSHDQMDMAYKGSKYALNINTVTNSETMFARRVYELMSSNTLVLSNSSTGMKKIFGDLVVFVDGKQPIVIDNVDKKRRDALMLVLKYHTYEMRFKEMLRAMKIPYIQESQSVTFLYRVWNTASAKEAFDHFVSIPWTEKKAVLWVSKDADGSELRKLMEVYNFNTVSVRSEHFIQTYEETSLIDTDYYIWATPDMDKKFINDAICHYCYIDKKTCIGVSENKYTFYHSKSHINVLIPSVYWKNENLINEIYCI